MKRLQQPKFSSGYELARTHLASMAAIELTRVTEDRLIASYGLKPHEAAQLIRSFQGRV